MQGHLTCAQGEQHGRLSVVEGIGDRLVEYVILFGATLLKRYLSVQMRPGHDLHGAISCIGVVNSQSDGDRFARR